MYLKNKFSKNDFFLLPILILSSVLNFANIGIEGFGNTYYAAGVKSMTLSLKNFFFVSFDPSGFVTIDKPPVGFWLQAISAKIFGFKGWSIILPESLAGVISVALIYFMVKRSFGFISGLIAALCLTVTPIFVAAARNNTIDNILVLAMLLSCWAITKAMSDGKIKYIILSFVFLGIGYNIKMSEALLLLPSLYVTYFLVSSIPLKKRFINLGISTLIFLVISLSWAVIVDLVPSSDRPFIGSSTNNSVTQLMLGHNGLDRLKLGSAGTNTAKKSVIKPQAKSNKLYASKDRRKTDTNVKRPLNPNQIPSFLRLFSNNDMTDQISWLLPFAIIGFIASSLKEKLSIPLVGEKNQALVLWFMWLLPEFLYFSFSRGTFHTYYMTTMAPPIAALTGIGMVSMLHLYGESDWKQFILPSAFIINGLVEAIFLSYNYGKTSIYKPMMAVSVILSLVPAFMLLLKNRNIFMKMIPEFKKGLLTAIAFIGLIIAPAVWSFTPMFYPMNGGSPSAGLELTHNSQIPAHIMNSNTKLINFLKTNNTNEKYILAVPSATTYASSLILETGDAVMAIGGFSGNDKIISLDEFKQLVSDGKIRYALINIPTGNTFTRKERKASGPNGDIINWIMKNGKAVQDNKWERVSKNKNSKNTSSLKLYDLKANHNSKKSTVDNSL